MMKSTVGKCTFILALWGIAMVFGPVMTASAGVTIDPTTGLDSYFEWEGGTGQIDNIDSSGEAEWTITLSSAGSLDITANDGFVVGDEFALYVDGVLTAWTSEYYDGSGYYYGVYDDLTLSAGTHTLTLYVTELASGYTSGGAYASFSSVTPVPVPAPGAVALVSIGASLVGWMKRRRAV